MSTDEENQRDLSGTSCLTLKNAAIILGSVTALAVLLFVAFGTSTSAVTGIVSPHFEELSREQTPSSSHSLIMFAHGGSAFTLNPSQPVSEARHLINKIDPNWTDGHISKDNMQAYFLGNGVITVVDVASRTVKETIELPDVSSTEFLLRNPNSKEIIYVAVGEGLAKKIRHYDLNNRTTIKDYGHSCKFGREPVILEQFNDGSSLIYMCKDQDMVYLKKLNGSDDEDEELFENFSQHKILVTPDDQKMILFKYNSALGSIRFRLIDFSDLKSWKFLPTGLNNLSITSMSFSDDGSKLHVLYKRSLNDDFELATFDYEEYMNRPSDSSDEAEIDDVNEKFDSPDFDELLNYSPNSNDKPMILISIKPVSILQE